MGLGLSALTALLLLLPGIAFVFGLSRLFSAPRPPSPFEQHFSLGLVLAVVAALALHLVGFVVLHGSAALGWTDAPAPAHALLLLSGDLKPPLAAAALAGVERNALEIGAYLLVLIIAGIGTGQYANRWIPDRIRADWARLLAGIDDHNGEPPALVVLTTEVTHGSSTWLYSGYLDDYSVDREGRLERVVFRGYAARRLLRDEQEFESLDDPTFVPRQSWIEIPGEVFVLLMAQARTVNLDFFFDQVDATEDEGEDAGVAEPIPAP